MVVQVAKCLVFCAMLVPLADSMRPQIADKLDEGSEEASPPTKFWHWMGNDYIQIDVAEQEEKLRRVSPGMLFPEEKVEMCFKVGKNKVYFTDARIILRPKSTLGKSATYTSVPYESIKAYEFETAGTWPNMDTDLKLFTNVPGMPTINMGFRKGTRQEKANIYEVGAFFAKKLLGLNVREPEQPSALIESAGKSDEDSVRWEGFWDGLAWLGGDNTQMDAAEVEESLRKGQILGDEEKVLMAFKVGRDTTLLTSRRLMKIDVKGLSGKAISYFTIPYEAMKAFEVRTAGHFDLDSEVTIWTDIPGYTSFQYDLRAGKADTKGVHALLCDKILGIENPEASSLAQTKINNTDIFDIFHWLGGNFQQVSAKDAEHAMRQQDILQAEGEEYVMMAFRVGRDCNMLTNKRLLMVDVQGFGKKVQYRSVPYHGVQSYGITTAGYFDLDSEIEFWTAVTPPPAIPTEERCPSEKDPHPPAGLCPPPPPPPQCPTVSTWQTCMSYFKFDLAAGRADLWGIQQVLNAKVLGFENRPNPKWSSLLEQQNQSSRGPINDLYDWFHFFDGNSEQVNPRQAEDKFKYGGILQQDESVKLAFRLGNDFHIWSNKRFLLVDRKGWFDSSQKVVYRSTPYVSIKAFSWTSAGIFDSDSELEFWTAMPWLPHYKQDLRAGRINAQEIMHMIGREVSTYKIHPALPRSLWPQTEFAHSHHEPVSLVEKNAGIGDFIAWLGGAGYKIDADEINTEFHTEKPFLLSDEQVKFAVKAGRDRTLITNKRTMLIDVQGISGTSVHYKSIPFGAVGAFSVESPGLLSVSSEMQLFTTAYGLTSFSQPFRKGEVDIFAVSDLLTTGMYQGMIAA